MKWIVFPDEYSKEQLDVFLRRYELLGGSDTTCIVCTQNTKELFSGLNTLELEPSLLDCLGEQCAVAYGLLELLEKQKIPPTMVVLPLQNGLGYYAILEKLCGNHALQDIVFIVYTHESCSQANPEYLFPAYYLRRIEQFCLSAADWFLGKPSDLISDIQAAPILNEEALRTSKELVRKEKLTVFPFPQLSSKASGKSTGEPGLLSIIVPFCNLGKTVEEALDSAFACDYPNREILLFDDGSDDVSSLEKLQQMKKKHPLLHIHTLPHGGLFQLRNRAVQAAHGEYVTFLDADDKVAPSYYRRMITVLNRFPNVAYAGSWVHFFGEINRVEPYFTTDLPLSLLRNTHTSFAVSRRDLYLKYASNRQEMKHGFEDHEAWVNMAENGFYGVCVPQPLCYYRMRSGSLSKLYTTSLRLNLYDTMISLHPRLYEKYFQQIIGLLQANGPSYLWANPTLEHGEIVFDGTGSAVELLKKELAKTLQDLDNVTQDARNLFKQQHYNDNRYSSLLTSFDETKQIVEKLNQAIVKKEFEKAQIVEEQTQAVAKKEFETKQLQANCKEQCRIANDRGTYINVLEAELNAARRHTENITSSRAYRLVSKFTKQK